MDTEELCFIKLGGSLITDKSTPHTARLALLAQLAGELAAGLQAHSGLRLVLGHGSGSFGHVPAHHYGTRAGVHTPAGWLGFIEVWREARALNQIVIEALLAAHLPVIGIAPSAGVTASDGDLLRWDLAPIQAALSAGLIPVINGDVIFDQQRGGTILSTEELFMHLARQLHPRRILLAGIEPGVWTDFPTSSQLIAEITPANIAQVTKILGGAVATDVTGGMLTKVRSMLDLVTELPELEVQIFSASQPGQLRQALDGARPGTRIFRGLIRP